MERHLFVIEGLDGSGKATQTNLLQAALEEQGIPCRHVSFPDYDSESSALVKLYLNGAFGSSPADVNPYAASSFYAVDRFASFQRDWKREYEGGSVILADRYATSNLIYQLSKVERSQWDSFIDWAESYEYDKLQLPRPTATIYLDMAPEISQGLLRDRYGGDESKKDLHERNVSFLEECRQSALYSAKRCGWKIIRCDTGTRPKTMEEIHSLIMAEVLPCLTLGRRE
ncbi:MAG: thymidylate kinase [Oscillospiraceae bacterium]|nr:thymidylate kinase [Oscillospiraceae bacterium]